MSTRTEDNRRKKILANTEMVFVGSKLKKLVEQKVCLAN